MHSLVENFSLVGFLIFFLGTRDQNLNISPNSRMSPAQTQQTAIDKGYIKFKAYSASSIFCQKYTKSPDVRPKKNDIFGVIWTTLVFKWTPNFKKSRGLDFSIILWEKLMLYSFKTR